ncbi:AAA family ATPase [uncultured Desulfosarcina sp.]|uniref:AAA family ATPase n=1 Tax=uncultured Desulfosarcina sp. TaxID=218289 RepID=UPI0029C762BE|nr:AAA family ATPase [uncultured Desulfosarcina sp.]
MRILSYEASAGYEDDIEFNKMKFGRLNLIVGNSGTGKTRLLNTIFNSALLVTKEEKFFIGKWDITLEHNSEKYRWIIETGKDDNDDDIKKAKILKERIIKFDNEKENVLVDRSLESFIFNDKELPKLPKRESSISLLKDEKIIKPIYDGLSSIMRRNFSGSDLEQETSYQTLPYSLFEKIQESRDLENLFHSGLNLNCKLYVLSEVFKDIYDKICATFIETFPFVTKTKMLGADNFGLHYPGIVPAFSMKEKFSKKWISLNAFSSGMKKVLLILCDVYILPETGCVYLVDEYENSLGVNAINFFPSVLYEAGRNSQFIITSHHPYIIGNVPVKDWLILHRKGSKVFIQQGEELEEKFGKSKQKAFIQLINDSFYVEGIE